MEEKIKRESRDFLEKLFKEYDKKCTGAVTTADMKKIVQIAVLDFSEDDELNELMQKYVKGTKYVELNKETKQFETKYQKESLDFPSALAISVHFLKKREKKNSNAFAGLGMVRCTDLPATHVLAKNDRINQAKKLF